MQLSQQHFQEIDGLLQKHDEASQEMQQLNELVTKQQYALPVNTARVYGPSLRPVYTGAFFDTRTYGTYVRAVCTGSPYRSAEYTARIYGCQKCTRLYGP